jgi:large subunit ribosomal protein L18
MSLTKPERRQGIQIRNRLVVLLQIQDCLYLEVTKKYAQLIDDVNGVTILAASSREKEKVLT